jgi:hypothetical protein
MDRTSCATAVTDSSVRTPKSATPAPLIKRFFAVYGSLFISPTLVSRVCQLSPALARRFIAARIKTSSSVKPRVVIFHMTSHNAFERRTSLEGKIRANVMPHLVMEGTAVSGS